MKIPKHYELRVPLLTCLQNAKQAMRLREFIQPLAMVFQLSEQEVAQTYPSGNGEIFADRISWGLSYLNMSGLVDKPKRGLYQINDKGLELLNKPHEIDDYIQQKMLERKSNQLSSSEKTDFPDEPDTTITPQESLYQSYKKIRLATYDEILSTILTKTPYEFEQLVLLLLQKMGYGGEVKGSASRTQSSHDGGIDGIIKEDVLGLGRIHIQAKRYQRDQNIGREDIQKFVGALAVAQSNKGIFITTSSYTKTAVEYAASLNRNTALVLIDGNQLAEYIYDYGLGMQVEQTIKIKKLDADFWDAMKDNG